MAWKYKQAYELLADFIWGPKDVIEESDRINLADDLDEIFGADRRC